MIQHPSHGASLVAQMVKNPLAMWETWLQSLGREDPMEKGIATHSSTVAWRIPRREEPGELWSMGSQRVGHDCMTNISLSTSLSCVLIVYFLLIYHPSNYRVNFLMGKTYY